MKNVLISGITMVVVALGVFVALDYTMTMPIVKEDIHTKTCVEVDVQKGVFFDTTEYNCENMPTKYTHEWVEKK